MPLEDCSSTDTGQFKYKQQSMRYQSRKLAWRGKRIVGRKRKSSKGKKEGKKIRVSERKDNGEWFLDCQRRYVSCSKYLTSFNARR
jgi:hypothetical protein